MNGGGRSKQKSVPVIGQYYWLILVILEVHVDQILQSQNLSVKGRGYQTFRKLFEIFYLLPFISLKKVLVQIYQNMPQNVFWDKKKPFSARKLLFVGPI